MGTILANSIRRLPRISTLESQRLEAAAALLSVASAAASVFLFRDPNRTQVFENPILWLVLAAVLFGVATRHQAVGETWDQTDWEPQSRQGQTPFGFALLLGGIILVSYGFGFLAPQTLVLGWLMSQALLLSALMPGRPRPARLSSTLLAEAIGLSILLAVAAVPRFWDNGALSPIFSTDMAFHGLQARSLLAGKVHDFFGAGWAGIPIIGFVPSAISMYLVGDNLAGLNGFPAVAGLTSIAGLYMLTRELWGPRAAFFAAGLAAGNLYHLHYSRGAEYIDPLPFIVWCIYLLVHGLRRGRKWAFGLAGLFGGYAALMYYPGRIVLPMMLVTLALTAIAGPRLLWERRAGIAIAAVALALVAGPTLVAFVRAPNSFNERVGAVSLFNHDTWIHNAKKYGIPPEDRLQVIAEQFQRSALVFWKYNDAAPQFAIERNMLDPVSGVLVILGLGVTAWSFKRPASALVLVWLGGYVASSTLTGDPPSSSRMLGEVLPVSLIGGLGLDRVLAMLPPTKRWAAIGATLALLAVAYSGLRNWQDYQSWTMLPQRAYPRNQVISLLMVQPPSYQIRIISPDYGWDHSDFQFLLQGRTGESIDPKSLSEGTANLPEGPTIFVISREYRPLAAQLQSHYPSGRLVDGSTSSLQGVFYLFYVP